MADPLSTTASVVAVVGFAAESSKTIFKVFRGFTSMPANVQESMQSLKSLQITMTNLQQSGLKLDPNHKFSSHFCSRLNECLKDLNAFKIKIAKIEAQFGSKRTRKHNLEGKVRRSCERIRWMLKDEQEIVKFFDKVKIYYIEFSLELSTLIL